MTQFVHCALANLIDSPFLLEGGMVCKAISIIIIIVAGQLRYGRYYFVVLHGVLIQIGVVTQLRLLWTIQGDSNVLCDTLSGIIQKYVSVHQIKSINRKTIFFFGFRACLLFNKRKWRKYHFVALLLWCHCGISIKDEWCVIRTNIIRLRDNDLFDL